MTKRRTTAIIKRMNAKSNKLQIIVLAPVIAGIILIVAGIVNDRGDLLTAGIVVLFGGSFFVAVITCIITIGFAVRSNTYSKADSRDDCTDSVMSEARERAIQKTGGRSSETDAALKRIEARARKRKRVERFTKFFGILFVIAFISFLFGGMGLMISGYLVAGGIVFACGPAMILIAFIVVQIKTHVVRADRKLSNKNYRRKVGCVTSCVVKHYTPSKLYRIELEVGGRTYTTDSEQSYSVGEKVEVTVYNSGKFGSIIGRTEHSFVKSRPNAAPVKHVQTVQSAERQPAKPVAPTVEEKTVTAPAVEQPIAAAHIEEEVEQEHDIQAEHAPPYNNRPTVGYKGINRKQ